MADADADHDLPLQPSLDAVAFDAIRYLSRSPASLTFDASSSPAFSPGDLEQGSPTSDLRSNANDARRPSYRNDEKQSHEGPNVQRSYDPILPPEKDDADRNIVDWDGERDPENPMHWPLRRKLWMSGIASFFTFCEIGRAHV